MPHKIMFGLIGFLLGGMTGGFLMGCVCGKEYKKRIDDLQARNVFLKQELRELKTGKQLKRETEAKAKEVELDNKIKEYGYGTFDSDEEVEFNDPFTEENEETDDEDKEIHLIGKAIYDEDLSYRDSESLTFYQQDGILADEFDEPINNQIDIIGMEAIEAAETTNEDYLYVSNDILDKIYEITIEHNESYYRDLMQ